MKPNLFIEKCKSEKTHNEYLAIKCDLGYRVAFVNIDLPTAIEMSGKTAKEVYELKVGESIAIGYIGYDFGQNAKK